VTSGVEYNDYPPADTNGDSVIDQKFIYGPQTFDVGLTLPGKLTGASAQSIEHLIDNFNAPKPSPYTDPVGLPPDTLAQLFFGVSVPLNSPFGCRLQHIYRAGDASPAYNDFNGVILDLVGLAWSPVNDKVTNTVISDMQVLVGLSGAGDSEGGNGPSTQQSGGIPEANGDTGLIQQFDCNLLEWAQTCCLITPNHFVPELVPLIPTEPPMTTVVSSGTAYPITQASLFKPLNGGIQGTFNFWINYPAFNAGIDPIFGKPNTLSYPYDSRFPMLIEYRLKPAAGLFPSTNNFYRFSPAVLSSALPRFRVWSQGQDPLANCIPNFALGAQNSSGIACGFYAGEGGPLLEPGTFSSDVLPPSPNNNMPVIHATTYQLPPMVSCAPAQLPLPDKKEGKIPTQPGQQIVFPTCNTDPNSNWYYADGELAYPLPNLALYQGPTGTPKSTWYGYGNTNIPAIEPNYTCMPGKYGDNSRYFMMWKYRKRVSIIESPTIEADSFTGLVEYQIPIIDPPLSQVDPNAGLIIQIRAGTDLDFSVPVLESGYVNVTDPDFVQKVSGDNLDRTFVKFRASFAVAPTQSQPPFIDTIVIPYREVAP
jgi:hypothetical protein